MLTLDNNFLQDELLMIYTDYSVGQFPMEEYSLPALDIGPIAEGSKGDPSRWLCGLQIGNSLMICNTKRNVRS